MDMQGTRSGNDGDYEELDDFITINNTIEELEILNETFVSKQHQAYRKLDKTVKNLRFHGAKEKSNKKVVELEKMLNISTDENFALKIRIDELEKCMEEKETEFKELEFINQTLMVRERKYNDENQEAREELINSMQGLQSCVTIGVKRMGELDLAPFADAAKKGKCSGSDPQKAGLEPDSDVEAGLLCSLWERHLGDPGWHPFRMVSVGDKYQEIIDDEDPKLKGLKSELGEDAYKAVATSLMEMNEYNPSGRFPVSEIWNFIEGRQATLKEGYGFVFDKLKNVGKSSMVSSPSIAAANHSSYAATDPSSSEPYLDPCEIPAATKFHDFMADISHEKFRSGQIWALYCDLDELPKYYVQITHVKLNPDFELHVRNLDPSQRRKLQWADKNMPICCGTFNVGEETVVCKNMMPFSHQLCAKLVKKSNYVIYPRSGEVWALYKNFDSIWKCSDLKKCKYDIVEVLGDKYSKIKVLVLEQVTGFMTVFKPKIISGVDHIVRVITYAESLTFSHQIPAFRLMDEKEGSLQGYWELDPASLPVYLSSSN